MHKVALVIALGLLGSQAGANVINASFEEPVHTPGGYNADGVPGWSVVGFVGAWGSFFPTVALWGYTASHGNQVLYINSGTVEQVTDTILSVGQTYTLMVDVVRRPNFGTDNYSVRLMAGDTVLAEDVSTLTPAPGDFATSVLTYTVLDGDPLAGQALTIQLGGGNQVNFDHVRLTVPAPGSLCLLTLGGMVARRRSR